MRPGRESPISSALAPGRREGPREITELARTFAGLLARIEALNARIGEEAKVKRQAELRALQMQINPHFIYNSLDSIRWLTLAGKKAETAGMIDGLARFFRLGLCGGKERVRISHEIEHAESYLAVQKIRFADRLGCMIDVHPDLLALSIPKIVLQPLIENSLAHGMKGRERIFITVRGVREESSVRFEVIDDGCGMRAEEVRALNDRLACPGATVSEAADEHGSGLVNVNARIKLHYGAQFGINCASSPGVGTRVTVRIPADGEAEA